MGDGFAAQGISGELHLKGAENRVTARLRDIGLRKYRVEFFSNREDEVITANGCHPKDGFVIFVRGREYEIASEFTMINRDDVRRVSLITEEGEGK